MCILLDKLEEVRASVKKVGAQFNKATTTITHAHKRRKLLEVDLERGKANKLKLQGKPAEIEASLKKAKDGVSLLERKVADLDVGPQVTTKEMTQVEVAKKRA